MCDIMLVGPYEQFNPTAIGVSPCRLLRASVMVCPDGRLPVCVSMVNDMATGMFFCLHSNACATPMNAVSDIVALYRVSIRIISTPPSIRASAWFLKVSLMVDTLQEVIPGPILPATNRGR